MKLTLLKKYQNLCTSNIFLFVLAACTPILSSNWKHNNTIFTASKINPTTTSFVGVSLIVVDSAFLNDSIVIKIKELFDLLVMSEEIFVWQNNVFSWGRLINPMVFLAYNKFESKAELSFRWWIFSTSFPGLLFSSTMAYFKKDLMLFILEHLYLLTNKSTQYIENTQTIESPADKISLGVFCAIHPVWTQKLKQP